MMYTVNMKPARRSMPRLFEDPFFRSVMGEPGFRPNPLRVDVREQEDAYLLEAELPGVPLEGITLTVENDVLTIAADLNRSAEEPHEGWLLRERRTGHVERRFSLEGICQEGITADSVNGVLTIQLPKEKPEGPKAKRVIAIGQPGMAPCLPEGGQA